MAAERECGLTMHESILIATDGSTNSDAALREAISMAKACKSILYILHVIDTNVELLALEPQRQVDLEQEAAKMLDAAANRARDEEIRCESILIWDDPYKSIVREAEERKISLIVIGSHGRTGVKKMLLGSVCQQVIGHTPCPVLVVPGRPSTGETHED